VTEDQVRQFLTTQFGPEGWELALLLDNPGSPKQLCIVLRDREKLLDLMYLLRNDPQWRFDQLIDLAGVDYLNYPDAQERFGVVYSLLSDESGQRLWIKMMFDEPDLRIPSVAEVWPAAGWMEREVYDLLGIVFEGHKDLRRIVCPEWFTAHPLRKDYPLRGMGERESLPVVTREDA